MAVKKLNIKGNGSAARLAAVAMLVFGFLAVFNASSASQAILSDPIQNNETLEIISVVFLVLAFASGFFIHITQGAHYWPSLSRNVAKDQDERTATVRSQVFERAYVLSFIYLFALIIPSDMGDKLVQIVSAILATVAYLFMPSAVAAFRKDS